MALKKQIILPNGIPVEYHRIAQIDNIINKNTIILVVSYINQEQRNREKHGEIQYSDDVFKINDIIPIPYNDTLTIKEAYEYLKTTEKYKDAEDVFDEEDNFNEEDKEMINDDEAICKMF